MAKVQRWYLGYSYRGKPQELIERVSKIVQDNNLSNYLPLLRLEKGAKPRKAFYFFLAIQSDRIGTIPEIVEGSHLLKLPYFKSPAVRGNAGFTYEQIKKMVGAAHDVCDYTYPIPYQPREPKVIQYESNWIASSDCSFADVEEPHEIEERSQRCDRLLYWLSALGCGTRDSFNKVCDTLNLHHPTRILRRLKLLGHLESSADGKRWSVAPPALVKINSASDTPEFILCGQRSIKLLEQLQHYAEVISKPQPLGNAPACIRVKTTKIEEIAQQISILNPGEVSLQLAELLPDIATWQQHLITLSGIVCPLYQWKRFDGELNDFIECSSPNETGMYQMLRSEKIGIPPRTLFYEADTKTWRQGDWYGLRFLAHHHSDRSCIVPYDTMMACLMIPSQQRSPEIYERALVLASGFLPTYYKNSHNLWLVYENIRQDIVEKLVEKLHVTCKED